MKPGSQSHAELRAPPQVWALASSLSAVRTSQPEGLPPGLHGPRGSTGQGGDGHARPRPESGVPRPGARTRCLALSFPRVHTVLL